MKRLTYFFATLCLSAMVCISCTKEGPQGAPGEDGTDGMDGLSGTAGCIQCHTNNENMTIKSSEWATSAHVNGGHMTGYYASRDGCADCHSSQGYQLAAMGSWDNPAPDKPLPANCYTCHQIHETYTSDDWAFRVEDGGMPFLVNNQTSDQGNANTCIVCHQSRIAEPEFTLADNNVSITNKRFGPHHGPQGNMVAGAGVSGAYEVAGSMNYVNSMHASDASTSCVTCHMASGAGSGGNFELGGHSNNVAVGSWDDDSREVNVNGCISCHTEYTDNAGITAFVATARTANLALIDQLAQELTNLGYLDGDGYIANGGVTVSSSNALVVSPEHAAAIYNYKLITEDRSVLIHNPKYAKALINNSIEALQ